MALWKKTALEEARNQINQIEDEGHQVRMFTDYHWRIDQIDVWPSSKKYMREDGIPRKFGRLEEIFL